MTSMEAAARIGARLERSALWEGDACTWNVLVADTPGRGAAVPVPAGGAVYQGSAGIALFLAELAALTGDPRTARTALGALRHALARGGEMPPAAFGFFAGRVGIAYVAARAAELLGADELRDRAALLLAPLAGRESEDAGTDVVLGAAGAIPALLRMAGSVEGPPVGEMARRLGDHLVATAVREPDGWSWNTIPGMAARNLNGYAHGAAGCGHALLELFHATGEARYRYGAEQAFTYERRTFDPRVGDWPDLRSAEMAEHIRAGRLEELRARRLRGLPRFVPRFMDAWCHGAPGIGLTRLRAWQLLGAEIYRAEAEAALRATARTLEGEPGNYSLCHGAAGNAETLLMGSEILGDPSLRERAEACMRGGCERFEAAGAPWPSGVHGASGDPSLMLGEAGTGHLLLRLHSPSVPPILLLTAPGPGAPASGGGDVYAAMAAADAEAYFRRTLRVFRALGEELGAPAPGTRAPAAAVYDAVAARIADGALLEDASRVDRARVELSRAVEDYTREPLDAALHAAAPEVPWNEVEIALSERVRVVRSAFKWDEWLAAGDPAAPPERGDVFVLLHASAGLVSTHRLGTFAAVVLEAVRSPLSFHRVVERVAEAFAGASPSDLEPHIREQLRQAYRAGFVDCAPLSHRDTEAQR
jgi:hypothetical protein